MKDRTMRQYAVTLTSALTLAAIPAWGQLTTPPTSATSAPSANAPSSPAPAADTPALPADDETIQLSPFEVRASANLGYQENETLAGTRIRTSIRDVGSAISVLNKQFLADTGATDSQTLLQYATSMEVGGTRGNFGGSGDGSVINDSDQRLKPHGTTRVRGLVAADNTRNFFATDIPWDSYNTSRIDIQRGANSILFGNGSGAGIINGEVDGAVLGKNSTVIEGRYGSYDSYRGSFNLNRDLIPGQLALRFSSLYKKDYFRQDPAFNRDKRYYGALRFEPSFLRKGGARTSLKASYEKGDIDANRPRTTTIVDQISPYFMTAPREIRTTDGVLLGTIRPMVSGAGYDPFVTGLNNTGLITANPGRRDIGAGVVGTANTERWLIPAQSNGINGDWFNGFGAIYADPNSDNMAYYVANGTSVSLYNALSGTGTRDGNVSGLRAPTIKGIGRFDQYTQGLGVLPTDAPFLYDNSGVYRATTITDPSIFDFYNKLLDGPNKKEWADFDAFNVSLDQTFFNDKAGFQLAYDAQTYTDARQGIFGGSPAISIDVYRYLPVAQLNTTTGLLEPMLNPNFGKAFVAGSSTSNFKRETERETTRLTPFVDLDFQDMLSKNGQSNLLTKILGRHTITGLLERNQTTSSTLSWNLYSLSNDTSDALSGPNIGQDSTDRKIVTVNYLSGSLVGGSLAGANLSSINGLRAPTNGPAWYFGSNYLATAPAPTAVWTTSPVGLAPNQNGGNVRQAENPLNYGGWSTQRSINVINADLGDIGQLYGNATSRRDETKSWAIVDQWALLDRHLIVMGGLRKDEIETFRPGNPALPADSPARGTRIRNANGAVDFSAPFEFPDVASSEFESSVLKTYSVVAHAPEFITRHLPWTIKPSLFYSQSENFKPEGRVGVFGQPIDQPTGSTKDFGFLVNAFKNRLSLKVNWYTTEVKNATLGDNSVITRIGDEVKRGIQFALAVQQHASGYSFTNTANAADTRRFAYQPATGTAATWTTADWEAAEALAQSHATALLNGTLGETAFLNAWNIHPEAFNAAGAANDWGIRHDTPAGMQVTGDTESDGMELELFLRPTDSWNITLNASETSAQRLNLAGTVSEFVEKRWALYQGPAGQLRWFGGGQGSAASSTGLARLGRNAWAYYQQIRSQEGNDVPELRPWRFNIVNTYTFSRGSLKGIRLGGSYRWQDRNVIGYGVTEVTPASPGQMPTGKLDISKPFYGPKEDAIDLWVGYSKKLFSRYDFSIQLNVRNAFDKVRLIPVNTNPDGTPASYRIADGATWELTHNIKF